MMYAASDVSHRADDTWTRIVWYARRRPYVAVAAVLSALTVLGLFISPGWGSYDQLPQEGADAGSKTDISPYVPPQLGDATTTIIPADDGGVLLSSSNVSTTTFASPNRAYTLKLRPDGDLVLTHNDDAGSHPVWSTGTGDNHAKGGHKVVFTTDVEGHTRMELRRKKKDEDWHIVWHSDLDPICKRTGVGEDGKHHKGSHDAHSTRQFVLSDNGTLRIAGLCNLYTPPSQQNKQRSLAVLVSGLYRTNNVTCYTQVKNLIQDHPSFKRVDVFARILYEDKDLTELNRTAESIEAEVKDCYGKYLKTVTVVPAAEAEEDYPGGSEAMLQPCGDKLRRLNNQLKTIDAAARDWWAWTVKQGFTHDTILRIRPDTLFHGSDKPMFLSLEDLRNSVILPHPKNEHYFYCPRMSGAVGVGEYLSPKHPIPHREQQS